MPDKIANNSSLRSQSAVIMNAENRNLVRIHSDKEKPHVKIVAELKPRNALGDICGNVVLQNQVVSTHKSVKSTVVKKTKNVRPKSESGAGDTKVKYYFKSENVTQRETKNEEVCCSDEVFVSGVDHYLNFASKPSGAGSSKTAKTVKPIEEADVIKKPVQKIKLLEKIKNRRQKFSEENLYKDHLYEEEYFEDNYQYMLQMENDFIYRKDVLKNSIEENYRRVVVNWLTYVHQLLGLTESTFFTVVRMLDYILAACKVPSKKYCLVGLACVWITNKQLDIHYFEAPKLSTLFNGKFSRTDLLTTEKQILRVLNFKILFPEPSTFLFHYLKRENLENNAKVRHSAMFLLEVFALLIDFSTLAPSVLACIALHQVMIKYKIEDSSFLEFVSGHLVNKNLFLQNSTKFGARARILIECKTASNEVVAKYSKEEWSCVAKNFICN